MQWMPIETAPKDGTHILAHGTYQWEDYATHQKSGIVVVAWYDADGWGDSCWVLVNANPYRDKCQPTHWMPLPPPPESAT